MLDLVKLISDGPVTQDRRRMIDRGFEDPGNRTTVRVELEIDELAGM